jgi:uncharacterized protein (TIGR00661 family)
MKILYAVQGTGNGHITRAIEIIPHLKKHGEVDILVSGIQSDIELPFKVKYKLKGLSFIFGKEGGIDMWKTYWNMNSIQLLKEIKFFPIDKYDLIISDFEPVSAWAALRANKPCIGLSNQVATLHPLAPKPKRPDLIGKLVLEKYCPTTINYGFHFKSLDQHIFTPIIRQEVRTIKSSNHGHYTVYLPSYDDKRIIKHLSKFKDIKWEIFSKHSKKKYKEGNIKISPIDKDKFLESIANAAGVLCNAGFGTTSEALFLRKKLLVIPMKKQYEQHCNAAMLKSMGVSVMKKLNNEHSDKIKEWLKSKKIIAVDYPDKTEALVNLIVKTHTGSQMINTNHEAANYTIFQ